MKKTIKIAGLIMAILMSVSILVACGPSLDEVVGVYSGSYVYEGNEYTWVISLGYDGQYERVGFKNGAYYKSESGEFEIDGSDVKLYDSDSVVYHGSWMTYKYKKGTLENGNHIYVKTK